jgi:hypothetical protein
MLLHGGAALSTGGATLPIGMAGTAARKVAEVMTQRAAKRIDEMTRARSPLAESMPTITRELTGSEQAKRAMLARILIESQAGRRN